MTWAKAQQPNNETDKKYDPQAYYKITTSSQRAMAEARASSQGKKQTNDM